MLRQKIINTNAEVSGNRIDLGIFKFHRAGPAAAFTAPGADKFFHNVFLPGERIKTQVVFPDVDKEETKCKVCPLDRMDVYSAVHEKTE